MKEHRKHILSFVAVMSILGVGYVGYCINSLRGKQPLEFDADVDTLTQEAISDWYSTSDFFYRSPDLKALLYSLSHPQSPFLDHPKVSVGGLGGEGSIMISFSHQVAVFNEVNGKWAVGYLNVVGELDKGLRSKP